MVGDHYDFLYPLNGPLGAGTYDINFVGEVDGVGAVLEAELDDLPDAGSPGVLFTQTFTLGGDGGMYIGSLFDAGQALPAVDAGCGDTLRLRLSLVSGLDGGSAFYYFGMTLTLP